MIKGLKQQKETAQRCENCLRTLRYRANRKYPLCSSCHTRLRPNKHGKHKD